jgi:signal transduction histidine kinase
LGGGDCELVIQVIAKMPGIICDVEAAQEKMREATRLQEEASAEIRSVVGRMREEGLTMRDIAVVLGVTPQRVAQLAACETETESCPN